MRSLRAETARRLERHRSRVSSAKVRLKAEQAARNEAIQATLIEGGVAEREIADAAGVSRSMVSQLRRRVGL